MNLIRRNNNKDTLSLRDQFFSPFESHYDKMFNELVDGFFSPSSRTSLLSSSGYPKMDILEEEGYWVIKANVSGVKPEDVEVEILPDNVVQIKGKMSEEHQSAPDAVY